MMRSYLEITRPAAWTLAGFFVLVGALVSGDMADPRIYVAAASVALIAAGGLVFNDFLDRRSDSIGKKHRPIPSGRVNPRTALYYSVSLLLIGFLASTYVAPQAIILSFFSILFILLYSTHFRYYHVFGNFIVSYLWAAAFVMGGVATGNMLPVVFLGAFVALSNTAREILGDVSSYRADKAFGLKTIPVLYGVSYARMVSSIFILSAAVVLPFAFYYGVMGEIFMGVALGSIIIFSYSIYQNIKDRNSEKVGYDISWGMLVGIAAFVIGSLI